MPFGPLVLGLGFSGLGLWAWGYSLYAYRLWWMSGLTANVWNCELGVIHFKSSSEGGRVLLASSGSSLCRLGLLAEEPPKTVSECLEAFFLNPDLCIAEAWDPHLQV